METQAGELLTSFPERVVPAHSALVVIDMQNDFCAEGGYIHRLRGADMTPNAALAARIMGLVRTARGAAVPVVWVRAVYDPPLIPEPMRAKRVEAGIGDVCCAEGSWGAEFYGVAPAEGEVVFTKHCYDAFHGTGLEAHLKGSGVRTVVAAGVATNVCVESTLRDGFFRGFYIVVPEDCVGSYDAAAHAGTLRAVEAIYGDRTTARALADLWAGSALR